MKLVFMTTLLQLIVTIALVTWWGALLIDQAKEIAQISAETHKNPASTSDRLDRTERMIYSEGLWFAAVIGISTFFLLGLYYRDVKRTKALQAFFASLTHELKTPLTSVRLQAESIADAQITDRYLKGLVERLLQDSSRLETQVERALELARIEGGGRLMVQQQQMKPLIDRVTASWLQTEREKILIEDLTTDALIWVDTNALQTVFRNLLENSIRHSKKIPVTVTLSSETIGPDVRLRYEDNGEGSSLGSKELGRLFNRGSESQGAGVGLYLVSALMRGMGGSASFNSRTGFRVDLKFRGVT